MNRKLLKIFLGIFAFSIFILIFSNKSNAYAIMDPPDWDSQHRFNASNRYEFRVGDVYFESFSDYVSNMHMCQTVSPYVLEVLQEDVNMPGYGYCVFNMTELKICTSPARENDPYPYQGAAGTTATLHRTVTSEPLFYFNSQSANYEFENIILDGGWEEDHSGLVSTQALVKTEGSNNLNVIFGDGCILQNNCSTQTATDNAGGAVCCKTGTLTFEYGCIIRNCCATRGGAITVDNGVLITDGLTINQCYSTGTAAGDPRVPNSGNASAIEFCGYAGDFTCKGITVTNCIALNAETGGAAIEMQKGSLYFATSEDGYTINISNNYSTGTAGGVSQFSESVFSQNTSNIYIERDLVITNNYSGSTVSGYTVTDNGSNSNLCLDKHSTVNITSNLTSATNVGVTAINQHVEDEYGTEVLVPTDHTQTVVFANADNGTQGLENFYSDITGILGTSDGDNHAIFGAGSPPVIQDYTTLSVKRVDKGDLIDTSRTITYRVEYVKDGESHTENVQIANNGTRSFEIDVDSTYTVTLVTQVDEDVQITYTMPTGNDENPTINTQNNSATGSISVEDDEGIIIYTHTLNVAPATGIKNNTNIFSIIVAASIAGLIIIKIKNKHNR